VITPQATGSEGIKLPDDNTIDFGSGNFSMWMDKDKVWHFEDHDKGWKNKLKKWRRRYLPSQWIVCSFVKVADYAPTPEEVLDLYRNSKKPQYEWKWFGRTIWTSR